MTAGTAMTMAVGPVALLLLALPALVRGTARPWLLLLVLVGMADTAATMVPILDKSLQFPGVQWNWAGKAIDIAVMLAVTAAFIATRRLSAQDIGFTFRQAPGTRRMLLTVVLPYLVILAALTAMMFGNAEPPAVETIAYQATMPGLAEELVWRGLVLALFNKMFPARAGGISYGLIATSIVFGLIHAVSIDNNFALHFAWDAMAFAGGTGFILGWIRIRSGSLVLPVIVHNATNVILQAVPLLG